MSIFNESLPQYIQNELTNRQNSISGNPRNLNTISTAMSSTAWVRMTSGVDVLKKNAHRTLKAVYTNTPTIPGSPSNKTFNSITNYINDFDDSEYTNELAKNNVITSILGTNENSSNFILNGYNNQSSVNNQPYRHGIRPLPGITGLDCQSYSANGSLRKVTIKFTCWDVSQLDIMEILYMRPGYPVCVEWGWSHMIGDNKPMQGFPNFGVDFLNRKNTSIMDLYKDAYTEIQSKKGNIDICIGRVSNYSFNARTDGGYDCETTIVTYGEILDSLKLNYLSLGSTISKTGILNSSLPTGVNSKYSEGILPGILQEIYNYVENQTTNNNYARVLNITGSFNNSNNLKDDINVFTLKLPNDFTNINADKKNSLSVMGNNEFSVYIQLSGLFTLLNIYVLPASNSSTGSYNGLTKIIWGDEKGPYKCLAHPFQVSTNPQVCIINPEGWINGYNNVELNTSSSQPNIIPVPAGSIYNLLTSINNNTNNESDYIFLNLLENKLSSNSSLSLLAAVNSVFNDILIYAVVSPTSYNFYDSNNNLIYSYKLDTNIDTPGNVYYSKFLNLGNGSFFDTFINYQKYSTENLINVLNSTTTNDYPNIIKTTNAIINNQAEGIVIIRTIQNIDQVKQQFDNIFISPHPIPDKIFSQSLPANVQNIDQVLKISGIGKLTHYFADNNYLSAWIPNIYVNLNYLYSLIRPTVTEIDDKTNRNEITLNYFLKNIFSEIQNSIGSINDFQIYGNHIDNTISIIDRNFIEPNSNSIQNPNNIYSFQIDNTSSIVRSYNIKSQIFPEQSAISAISSQASYGKLGYQNRGLVDFNSGVRDRIMPVKDSISMINYPDKIVNINNQDTYSKSIAQLASFLSKCYSINKVINNDNNLNTNSSLNNNILRDLISNWNGVNDSLQKPYTSPIPIIISLDIPGIGGMKIGNLFNITGGVNTPNILPASFTGRSIFDDSMSKGNFNIAFLIKSLNHSIENNTWITHIEGYPFVLPDTISTLKKI